MPPPVTTRSCAAAPALGVSGAPLQVNFAKVREHVAAVEASLRPDVSAERLAALGVDVISAPARFADRRTRGRRRRHHPRPPLRHRHGRACRRAADLPGLDSVDYLTADEAFDVVRKPGHLLILGADARGLELAQAYTRLGVDATVIEGHGAGRRRSGTGARSCSSGCAPKGVRVRDGVEDRGDGPAAAAASG